MADTFTVLVENATDRAEELNTVADVAAKEDVRGLFDEAQDGEDLVRLVVHRAMVASVSRLRHQRDMTVQHVKAEAEALKDADPSTIRPIKDADVAEAQARRIRREA